MTDVADERRGRIHGDRGQAAATTIRPFSADDWPSLWPIVAAVLRRGDTYMYAPTTSEADARALWTGGDVRTFVAEADGRVAGSYVLRPNAASLGDHVANAGFMVADSMRGRGIGAALCSHALDEARLAGFQAMQFNAVVSTNVGAIRLWQRMGFEIVGTIPDAFRHAQFGQVAIHVMHRRL